MKKLLLFFIALIGLMGEVKAQVYPINFPVDDLSRHYGSYGTATYPNADARWTWAVGIEDGDTVAVHTRAAQTVYNDKTSESVTVYLQDGSFKPYLHYHGVWMYRYVFIDWNQDGQFGDGEDPGNELVSWAGVTSGALNDLPAITIPEGTQAGEYYMRFKVDWNNTNPGGYFNDYNNDIVANGGVVVDVKLIISDEEPDVNITVSPDGSSSINSDANDVFYAAVYKGTSTNSSTSARYIRDFTLNGKTITLHTTGISRRMYTSYLNAATDYFHVLAGTSYTPVRTMTGEWMHHYLYIDYNHDGVYANDDATQPDDDELVSYNYYDGTNKLGTSTNSQGNTVPLPAFTVADVTPGVYAMRIKQDWDWLDPTANTQKGDNNFRSNGGEIVDFRLIIHNPEVVLNATSEVVSEDGRSISSGGAKIEAIRLGRSVLTDGANVQYGSDNLVDGSGVVAYGSPVTLNVKPESDDYLLSEVKLQYGFGLDDDQYVAGLKQWDETDLSAQLGQKGGTVNLAAGIMESDEIRITVKTVPNPITAIGQVEVEKNTSNAIYDLQGRRVKKADKGIYIVNGKKIIY